MKNIRANKKGRSFVVIMLSIALGALILRFAVEQIIKISIEQNESYAQATIKLVSAALENFAKDNNGLFPEEISTLTQSQYLDKDYTSFSSVRGYVFNCSRLVQSGYNCSAVPVLCDLTGRTNYLISTGGLFIYEKCGRKD